MPFLTTWCSIKNIPPNWYFPRHFPGSIPLYTMVAMNDALFTEKHMEKQKKTWVHQGIWVIPSWVLAEANSNVPSCVPGEAEDLKRVSNLFEWFSPVFTLLSAHIWCTWCRSSFSILPAEELCLVASEHDVLDRLQQFTYVQNQQSDNPRVGNWELARGNRKKHQEWSSKEFQESSDFTPGILTAPHRGYRPGAARGVPGPPSSEERPRLTRYPSSRSQWFHRFRLGYRIVMDSAG